MCTLVILNEQVEGFPLIVAANRDERYNRQSRCPEHVNIDGDELIRPWDEERQGTWMGVARDGWFVGLTNQDDGHHERDAMSRGKVVDDCLHAGSHSGVAKVLAVIDPKSYNPFNLVFGRPGALFLCRVWEGHQMEFEPLEPGINVISNDCWAGAYDTKVERGKRLAEAAACLSGSLIDRLFKVMADHEREESSNPFQTLCVHADDEGFGTRSTSIITVSNTLHVDYWYSEGHPCRSCGLRLAGHISPRQDPVL